MKHIYWVLALAIALLPSGAVADTITRTLTGVANDGSPVSLEVMVDFTQTGGDFGAGTGSASVSFTLKNASDLVPFQSPKRGNPLLTKFMFNIPDGVDIAYSEARLLAGATVFVHEEVELDNEVWYPGCYPVSADEVRTGWYQLQYDVSTGSYGIFTNSFATIDGMNPGIVNPDVVLGCEEQGDVVSDIYVAGLVRFTVALDNLDESLDSAVDFLLLCSTAPGEQVESAFAAFFQSVGTNGAFSGFANDLGYCDGIVSTEQASWGSVKMMYR